MAPSSPDPSASIPRVLRTFVDRTSHLKRFRTMMERYDEPDIERILLLHGPSGIGKTLLLDRLEHECTLCSHCFARINLSGGEINKPIRIMRLLRDRLGGGAQHFAPWTQQVNYYYTATPTAKLEVEVKSDHPGGVNIENVQGMRVEGNIIGGHHIEIRDNFIEVSRPDIDPMAVQDTLAESFLDYLRQYVQLQVSNQKLAVLLFDDVDQAEHSTTNWLWHDFVDRVSSFVGLILVVTAQEEQRLEPSIDAYTRQGTLKSLKLPDVMDYMRLAGIRSDFVQAAAMMLMAEKGGHPLGMIQATRKFLDMQEALEEKDEDD